jgi:hypothetical protein
MYVSVLSCSMCKITKKKISKIRMYTVHCTYCMSSVYIPAYSILSHVIRCRKIQEMRQRILKGNLYASAHFYAVSLSGGFL